MKKIVVLSLIACAGLALKADVMNWMVNTGDSSSSINAAQLYSVQQTGDSVPEATGGTPLAQTSVAGGLGVEQQINLGDLNPSTTYFYIELGNYTQETGFTATQVAGAYSYTDLVSAGMISSGGISSTPSGASFGVAGAMIGGQGMSYGAVPEPGTAMLMLVGLAVAGLKRRRA